VLKEVIVLFKEKVMALFLVEVQKFQNSEFEPVEIVTADNAKLATEDADTRHAGTTHCRKVRQWTGALKDIEQLAKRGLKVCQGGGLCALGSKYPHLAKMSEDDALGANAVIDDLKKQQQGS